MGRIASCLTDCSFFSMDAEIGGSFSEAHIRAVLHLVCKKGSMKCSAVVKSFFGGNEVLKAQVGVCMLVFDRVVATKVPSSDPAGYEFFLVCEHPKQKEALRKYWSFFSGPGAQTSALFLEV